MDWAMAIPIAITVITIVGYFIAMKYYPEWVGISRKEPEDNDSTTQER